MKLLSLAALAVLSQGILGPTAFAVTNSWNTGSGKWEIASNWTMGLPSQANSTLIGVTPAVGPATITIDSTTLLSNAINSSLTIFDLTIQGSSMGNRSLFINGNIISAPLLIDSSLTIHAHGSLLASNAYFNVGQPGLFIDGAMTALSTRIGTNLANANTAIGYQGNGSVTLADCLWYTGPMTIGSNENSNGTLTMNGQSQISLQNSLYLGLGSNSTGTIWANVEDAIQYDAPSNSFPFPTVIVGGYGSGQMTLSNRANWSAPPFSYIGANPGGQGTLSIAGGSVQGTGGSDGSTFYFGLDGGTGTVWVTGNANWINEIGSIILGINGGVGQMVQSNGLVQTTFMQVGNDGAGTGTLTVNGGTLNVGSCFVGEDSFSTGTVWVTGGQLLVTNMDVICPVSVSNGTFHALSLVIQGADAIGTPTRAALYLAGGTNILDQLTVAPSEVGQLWMSGGQLITTAGVSQVGSRGQGQLTISNGFWLGSALSVGVNANGTITFAGGSAIFTDVFDVGVFDALTNGFTGNLDLLLPDPSNTGTGTVWLTGTQLTTTNSPTYIGGRGIGHMTMSGGAWLAGEVDVGEFLYSQGTLTMQGGLLIVTNTPALVAVGGSGGGHMSASGGSVITESLTVGATNNSLGEITMSAGGLVTVLSNLTVGDCTLDGFAVIEMNGGTLYVTNAAHNAVLEIRNGLFELDSGTLVVDKLVATNPCSAIFDHIGGTLSVGTLILDPNGDLDGDGLPNGWEQAHGLDPLSSVGNNGADGDPDGDGYSNLQEYLAGSDPQNPLSTPLNPTPFSFTSIVRTGNNIVLTWNTVGGTTNQVQVSPGGVGASYSTNTFTNLGPQMFITGSGAVITNFTDTNGATNRPARYYRIRLVP